MGMENAPINPEPKNNEKEIKRLKDEIYQFLSSQAGYKFEKRYEDADAIGEKIKTKINELHQKETTTQQELTDEDIEKYKNEIKNEHYINQTESLSDLYFIIKNNNITIEGSDGHIFKLIELIRLITEMAGGEKAINYITRSCGLKDKVKKLIEIEAIKIKNNKTLCRKTPPLRTENKFIFIIDA